MTSSRIVYLLFLPIAAIGLTSYHPWKETNAGKIKLNKAMKMRTSEDEEALARVKEKATAIADYAAKHNYNNRFCFLIDMRIPSGRNRFFVYNLESGSIEKSGLVAHGSGSDRGEEELYFSNTPNSNCTSLGRYKIGKSYYGRFGLAYKLYGLDESNSKAFERFVVLHGHECVPESPIESGNLCLSWGCPTVAPAFLAELKTYLEDADKPLLLWIYH